MNRKVIRIPKLIHVIDVCGPRECVYGLNEPTCVKRTGYRSNGMALDDFVEPSAALVIAPSFSFLHLETLERFAATLAVEQFLPLVGELLPAVYFADVASQNQCAMADAVVNERLKHLRR